jgi:hypothetical protein
LWRVPPIRIDSPTIVPSTWAPKASKKLEVSVEVSIARASSREYRLTAGSSASSAAA